MNAGASSFTPGASEYRSNKASQSSYGPMSQTYTGSAYDQGTETGSNTVMSHSEPVSRPDQESKGCACPLRHEPAKITRGSKAWQTYHKDKRTGEEKTLNFCSPVCFTSFADFATRLSYHNYQILHGEQVSQHPPRLTIGGIASVQYFRIAEGIKTDATNLVSASKGYIDDNGSFVSDGRKPFLFESVYGTFESVKQHRKDLKIWLASSHKYEDIQAARLVDSVANWVLNDV